MPASGQKLGGITGRGTSALQQLPLSLRLPAARPRRLLGPPTEEPAPRLPDHLLVVLLCLVGLALPAAHALDDDGRLRRRARARAHGRRAAPPVAADRLSERQPEPARLLQVRRFLCRLTR